MDNSVVVNRLIAWARWKLNSGNALGFPSSTSFIHEYVDNSRQLQSYGEVDGWCRETNNAVESLSQAGSTSDYFMIRLEYLSNVRDIKLKLELANVSKATYYRRLNGIYEKLSNEIEKKYIDRNETVML